MPLQPPKLDDRDFNSLFQEARSRIPRYLPEWTDWNPSDPGITLLQLQAWLTDTILYRLNQLPELNYIKFLQLLGVEQIPAQPARADLTFTLRENLGQADTLIPERVLVGVSDPDLEAPLFFETDRSFRAITARLDLLVHIPPSQDEAVDVTQANNVDGRSFEPFGSGTTEQELVDAQLILGFFSPLPFPRGEIGLQIYLAEEGQALLAAPVPSVCGQQTGGDPGAPALKWEWWDGNGWDDLDVTGDETQNLTQSGQVYFKVPGQIPSVLYSDLGLPAFQEEEEEQPKYYWFRIRVASGSYARAPKIDSILTNTVRATAAQTVFDEAVGSSDGSPNQVMSLRHSPVLADPPLNLEVDDGQGPQPWVVVTDFLGSGPHDAHYVLNRATGQITFGDGQRGRIPLAGQFNVIARKYRYGGGRAGNVGTGTITEMVTTLREVEEVTNHRPAIGGADEESLDDAKLRGPRDLLKTRDRAVTLEDFALLAEETPGALVARAHAYTAPVTEAGSPEHSDEGDDTTSTASCGYLINVVIVPQTEDAKPVPSEATKRLVCSYLDKRRLITTQVKVMGPPYHDIDVVMEVEARDDADLREVKNTIEERLTNYFHPLRGGEGDNGWPFGRDAYYSELLREIMVLPGVLRVGSLKLLKLLARFEEEPVALAEMDSLIQAERDAFPDVCPPDGPAGTIVTITEPENPDAEPERRYYVAAGYECCDLPVAEGALIALRQQDITVNYARGRGAR